MTTKRKKAKMPAKRPRRAQRVKQPRPGDWLVYAPDRTTLLDFGRDLVRIRNRLQTRNILLSDCFLAREPFELGEPMPLGAAEMEVR